MFEKSLADLVRGIRSHKDEEALYVGTCIAEIKREVKTDNMEQKAIAIAKLTYLHMMGYDMSWAAFHIIEVMSSNKFLFKRIGYLAAAQCFTDDTEVVMLATNLVKKDVLSFNVHESSIALSSISCFLNKDLAMDLANDIMALIVNTKSILRKKAILAMYCVFLKFPDALRPAFPRLKEKLDDPDNGVQAAAVNVITELARHNPKNYLNMAPIFFKLMTDSSNNWMLIKIIKLFGALCPLEPRLGKKLLDPLTNLMNSTSAMSLLFECISTTIKGMPDHIPTIQLCITKLRLFIEDPDQNLKYLGLMSMGKIAEYHPKLVQPHRDLIFSCLEDRDESIRRRVLDILGGLAAKKTLVDIVNKLRQHLGDADSAGYRDTIVSKIIAICSQNGYEFVSNFEWYITVLVELMRIEGLKDGSNISSQLLDVAIRVQDVRQFVVRQMSLLLSNVEIFTREMSETLYAVAFICGEYSEFLEDPGTTLLSFYQQPRFMSSPSHVQAALIHNSLKLYVKVLEACSNKEGGEAISSKAHAFITEKLENCLQSGELEVQERASIVLMTIKYLSKVENKGGSAIKEISFLFHGELKPVATVAQSLVLVPDDLDLDSWIYSPPSDSESDNEDLAWDTFQFGSTLDGDINVKAFKQADSYQVTEEDLLEKRKQRDIQLAANPHYLKGNLPSTTVTTAHSQNDTVSANFINPDNIYNKPIDLSVPIILPGMEKQLEKQKSPKKSSKKRKGKKGKARDGEVNSEGSDVDSASRNTVNVSLGELPEGVKLSDIENIRKGDFKVKTSPHLALDINLDAPLRDDEILPTRKHREVPNMDIQEKETKTKSKSDRKHRSKNKHKSRGEENNEGEKSEKKSKSKSKHKKDTAPDLVDMGVLENGINVDVTSAHKNHTKESSVVTTELDLVDNAGSNVISANNDNDDDLEFWLTNSDVQIPTKEPAPETINPNTPDTTTFSADVDNEDKLEDGSKRKHKKHSKHKHDKDTSTSRKHRKKDSKLLHNDNSDIIEVNETNNSTNINNKEQHSIGNDMLEFHFKENPKPSLTLTELAKNKHLDMYFTIMRCSPMHIDQVTIQLKLLNNSGLLLSQLEINIVDTISVQTMRQIGASSRDPVILPFQLSEELNENYYQLSFKVNNVSIQQKLKGTLTYMITSELGSTSEKIDFRLNLPVSAFIHTSPTPISNETVIDLLGSGSLVAPGTVTLPFKLVKNFTEALDTICSTMHLAIVEHVRIGATLYGLSIQKHHICALVKDSTESGVSVSVKTSDEMLTQSILDEIKGLV